MTVFATDPGLAGNSIALSEGLDDFAWTGGNLAGGADPTVDGTHFAISFNPIAEATNFAASVNSNTSVLVGAALTSGCSPTPCQTVTVTAATGGTAGNSIGTTDTLTNFSWAGTTLAGGADGQPSLVAFNNLYSGTVPTTGLCGTAPTVKWAYKTTATGIPTSPVLSLDGTKVAYVENSSPPKFHVLTIGTTGTDNGSLKGPAIPGANNNAGDTVISFGATGDSISSPFPDYNTDSVYVGAADGKLYKFTGVFGGTPALAGAPWPLTITTGGGGGTPNLTSPVLDLFTGRIFIGDGAGVEHLVRTTDNCTGAVAPPCVDSTTLTLQGAALDDGPLVDGSTGKVFVFQGGTGLGAGGMVEVVQANEDFTGAVTATFGPKKGTGEYIGAFDNAYFTSPSTGHLYVCGSDVPGGGNGVAALWVTGFTGSAMNTTGVTGPTEVLALSAGNNSPCSPLTEFFNPNIGGGTDILFVSVGAQCTSGDTNGCIRSFDITSGPTSLIRSGPIDEPSGTSGIVVDNASASAGASSIYFSTQGNATSGLSCGGVTTGGGCGIKLTQGAFQ